MPDFLQDRESDEDTHAWPTCDKCGEPSDSLESVGECEDGADWCLECIRTEVRAMLDEQAHDDEMRSIRGATDAELERF
jgi:hypothetical protein